MTLKHFVFPIALAVPVALAIPVALTGIAWPLAGAYAVETVAGDEAQTSYSWDGEAAPLAFDTRIEGRRIPDYLRALLEDARQLGTETGGGLPPPATLSQLRRRAEDDAARLDEVLRSEAYYNGRVSASVRQAAGGDFDVVYVVALGPRMMIRSFKIGYSDYPAGGEALPETGAELGLEPERAAKAERIIDLTTKALARLHNSGYPNAKLDRRRVIVDLSSNLADVTLYMTAGPRYRFGDILVSNEDGRTDPDYVRMLTAIEPGTTYDRSKVDDTTERLRDSGLFTGISISSGAPAADGTLPQRIDLAERKPRTVRLGAQWSSNDGAGVRASWEHRNIFGRAEKLTLALSIAQIEQSVTADFRKPNFLRADQSLLASAEIAHEDTDAYKEDRIKTGVSLERKLSDLWTGALGVTFQITETEDSNGRTDYQLFGVPATLRHDSSDNLLDPTRGARLTLKGTPYFGTSDTRPTTFTKLEATGSTYFTPLEEVTFALRGRYGMIAAGDTADIPGSTRFFAGGGGSVRGYGYQMAGPLDAQNDPAGGRSVLEANVETRYRASETIGIVAFIDGGQAFGNLVPSLNDPLLWGAGLGLRYYTPIGPIRADIAVPLNRRSGVDDAFQIYVSLGQAF